MTNGRIPDCKSKISLIGNDIIDARSTIVTSIVKD